MSLLYDISAVSKSKRPSALYPYQPKMTETNQPKQKKITSTNYIQTQHTQKYPPLNHQEVQTVITAFEDTQLSRFVWKCWYTNSFEGNRQSEQVFQNRNPAHLEALEQWFWCILLAIEIQAKKKKGSSWTNSLRKFWKPVHFTFAIMISSWGVFQATQCVTQRRLLVLSPLIHTGCVSVRKNVGQDPTVCVCTRCELCVNTHIGNRQPNARDVTSRCVVCVNKGVSSGFLLRPDCQTAKSSWVVRPCCYGGLSWVTVT